MENYSSQEKQKETSQESHPPSITSIAVNDETTALNLLVQFVNIA